jgi:hypothetical protein
MVTRAGGANEPADHPSRGVAAIKTQRILGEDQRA